MMKTYLSISLICLSALSSFSQEVITTGGDFFSNSTAQISLTIGEVVTETFTSSGVHLTQGEQQPSDDPTGSVAINSTIELDIFPNPTRNKITLVSSESDLEIELRDSRGSLIDYQAVSESNTQIDMETYERGVYYLNIYDKNDLLIKIFKVVRL